MDKNKFRDEIKARVASLDGAYLEQTDSAIFNRLIALPEFLCAPRVFTYLSIGREVDTRRLINYCRKIGKLVALPADCKEGAMNFACLNCAVEELSLGTFGIPMPPESAERLCPEAGDIIVVPALCCDEAGYRLGRGGGYYDRFLSSCPAFSVGLCREELIVCDLPTDSFDVRLDCLVTENRIARP